MDRTVVPQTGRTTARVRYACGHCGAPAARWLGRCPACGEWGTIGAQPDAPAVGAPVTPITEVDVDGQSRMPTGVTELDRVLCGGLVPGSATLLGGAPGLGKSTLVLQALGHVTAGGRRALLVSAEEPVTAVRRRAERIGALRSGLLVTEVDDVAGIVAGIERERPDVVAIDSIQTVRHPGVAGSAGSAAQVRAAAEACIRAARGVGAALVLVGHVTKDGTLAGPRTLEHLVDTVLTFEGDRHHALRFLRAIKHRHGPTRELGVLEMGEGGLAGLPDPSRVFLAERRHEVPGSVVAAALEGTRPVLVEVQALTVPARGGPPRRWAQGFDGARVALLVAVLEARAGVRLGDCEVFVNLAGGLRVEEPGLDLAICVALAGARLGRPVAPGLVTVGEVGLAGELRDVPRLDDRLAEAARLGLRAALVPAAGRRASGGSFPVAAVGSLVDALAFAGLLDGPDGAVGG